MIQRTDTGLKLKCQEGCAWKELSFTLRGGKLQGVDEYGMTSVEKPTDNQSKDSNLADFLIVIKRSKNLINLEGKNGTAWTMLNFQCPVNECHQYVDQHGITH